MEINFQTNSVKAFREVSRQIKRTQLSMESVVPDVNDDIGRIYSVQSSVLLKSKDLTSRGASVTGELSASLLYINELENAVFDLHFTQSFSLDYDLAEFDPEMVTQVRLFVSNSEARALNPRKVSLTVELGGELCAFKEEEQSVAVMIPPQEHAQIFTLQRQEHSSLINAVCEKTFVINEQFPFSAGKPVPERLVAQKLDFQIDDRQLIGSKILLKGKVCVSLCYISEGDDYPVTTTFSAPFSQLVDIGKEEMDSCSVRIEPTSLYFNLIDTIGGEKALDAEIHAVAQIISRYQQQLTVMSDAYSVQFPSELSFEPRRVTEVGPIEHLVVESDEIIDLPEDCENVLSVMPTLGPSSVGKGKAEISVSFDILYRSGQGSLSSARRMITASSTFPAQQLALAELRLLDNYYRPDGNHMTGRVSIELVYQQVTEMEVKSAVSMSLNEEKPFDCASFPSVTAVRVDQESVWELAKKYHSSCEKIKAVNEIDGPICGKMLLIPKCM